LLKRSAHLPQEAFDDLVGTVNTLRGRGVALDFQHPGNLMVDEATGRFGLVDVAESAVLGAGQSHPDFRQVLGALLGKTNQGAKLTELLESGTQPELRELAKQILTKYETALKNHGLSMERNVVSRTLIKEDPMDKLLSALNKPKMPPAA
jgi:hypothetical protein